MKLRSFFHIYFLIRAIFACSSSLDGLNTKFYTLIPGDEISIDQPVGSWHITRNSETCKAQLTCQNFAVEPSSGCQSQSLEIVDGNTVKLRYCGYTDLLEYEAKGQTTLEIKTSLKGE